MRTQWMIRCRGNLVCDENQTSNSIADQPCKPELFHHQQAGERHQAAVDINPTGASGTTTGTIVTAVVMTFPTGTHLHHAQKRTGRMGIK